MSLDKRALYHIEEMAVDAAIAYLESKVPPVYEPEPVTEYWTAESNARAEKDSNFEREVWHEVLQALIDYAKELQEIHEYRAGK